MSNKNPWWEYSGLTPPEVGEKEQELADPVEQTAEVGAKEQEPAGTVEVSVNTDSERENGGNYGAEDLTEEAGVQESDTSKGVKNSREAAKRREQERKQREQAIREEEATKNQETVKRILASFSLKDASGKPIETVEDFDRYSAEQNQQRLNRQLKAGQLTPEFLQQVLLDTPVIRKVIQQTEELNNAAKAREQEADAAKFAANMERELTEIRRINPNIKTVDDIIQMETGPEYARYISVGLTPNEAYRLANWEDIKNQERIAAEQAVRNATAGKNHLRSSPNSAGNPLSVPSDYVANMRRFIPDISDKDIAKIYRQSQKENLK